MMRALEQRAYSAGHFTGKRKAGAFSQFPCLMKQRQLPLLQEGREP